MLRADTRDFTAGLDRAQADLKKFGDQTTRGAETTGGAVASAYRASSDAAKRFGEATVASGATVAASYGKSIAAAGAYSAAVVAAGKESVAALAPVAGAAEKLADSMTALGLNAGIAGRAIGFLTSPLTLIAAGLAAVGLAAKSAVSEMVGTFEQARQLAAVSGVSAQKTIQLSDAISLLGFDAGTLTTAFFRMGNEIETGAVGLTRLGVAVKDSHGDFKAEGDLFLEVRDRLSELGSASERNAALIDIFGRSGRSLAPIFALSREEFRKFLDTAGGIRQWSDEAQRTTMAYVHAQAELALQWAALKQAASEVLLPALGALFSAVSGGIVLFERFAGVLAGIPAIAASIGAALRGIFTGQQGAGAADAAALARQLDVERAQQSREVTTGGPHRLGPVDIKRDLLIAQGRFEATQTQLAIEEAGRKRFVAAGPEIMTTREDLEAQLQALDVREKATQAFFKEQVRLAEMAKDFDANNVREIQNKEQQAYGEIAAQRLNLDAQLIASKKKEKDFIAASTSELLAQHVAAYGTERDKFVAAEAEKVRAFEQTVKKEVSDQAAARELIIAGHRVSAERVMAFDSEQAKKRVELEESLALESVKLFGSTREAFVAEEEAKVRAAETNALKVFGFTKQGQDAVEALHKAAAERIARFDEAAMDKAIAEVQRWQDTVDELLARGDRKAREEDQKRRADIESHFALERAKLDAATQAALAEVGAAPSPVAAAAPAAAKAPLLEMLDAAQGQAEDLDALLKDVWMAPTGFSAETAPLVQMFEAADAVLVGIEARLGRVVRVGMEFSAGPPMTLSGPGEQWTQEQLSDLLAAEERRPRSQFGEFAAPPTQADLEQRLGIQGHTGAWPSDEEIARRHDLAQQQLERMRQKNPALWERMMLNQPPAISPISQGGVEEPVPLPGLTITAPVIRQQEAMEQADADARREIWRAYWMKRREMAAEHDEAVQRSTDIGAANDIRASQRQLQNHTEALKAINGADQNNLRLAIDNEQERLKADTAASGGLMENAGNVARFVVNEFRLQAIAAGDFWDSVSQGAKDVSQAVRKTLSDNIFEFFKTGTLTAAKLWQSFMDSMLRAVANFLASQVVQSLLGVASQVVGAFGGGGGAGAAAGGVSSLLGGGPAGTSGGVGGVLGFLGAGGGAAASMIGGTTGQLLAGITGAASLASNLGAFVSVGKAALSATTGVGQAISTATGTTGSGAGAAGGLGSAITGNAAGLAGGVGGILQIVGALTGNQNLQRGGGALGSLGLLNLTGAAAAIVPPVAVALNVGTAIFNLAQGQQKEASIGTLAGTAIGAGLGTFVFPGVGTVLGAAIGGAFGNFLGGLFGGGGGKTHAQREADEFSRAVGGLTGPEQALGKAKSPQQLTEALLALTHANFGGGRGAVGASTAGFVFGLPGGLLGTRTPAGSRVQAPETFMTELLAHPEQFTARIQLGVSGSLKTSINKPIETFVKAWVENFKKVNAEITAALDDLFKAEVSAKPLTLAENIAKEASLFGEFLTTARVESQKQIDAAHVTLVTLTDPQAILDKVSKIKDMITARYQGEIDLVQKWAAEMQKAASAWQTLSAAVAEQKVSLRLGPFGPTNPSERVALTQERFEDALLKFRAAPTPEAGARVAALVDPFLQAASDQFARPSLEFRKIFDEAMAALTEVQDEATKVQKQFQDALAAALGDGLTIDKLIEKNTADMATSLKELRLETILALRAQGFTVPVPADLVAQMMTAVGSPAAEVAKASSMSDASLRDLLKKFMTIPVMPQMQGGGPVFETGPAFLHRGEYVVPAGAGGATTLVIETGAIVVQGAEDPEETARRTVGALEHMLRTGRLGQAVRARVRRA